MVSTNAEINSEGRTFTGQFFDGKSMLCNEVKLQQYSIKLELFGEQNYLNYTRSLFNKLLL